MLAVICTQFTDMIIHKAFCAYFIGQIVSITQYDTIVNAIDVDGLEEESDPLEGLVELEG